MSRRKVIAFLTNNAGMRSDYQGLLRQGIEQACVERDIDLWVYSGRSDWRSWGAAQARIYEMVSLNRVDGIIVAAGCIAAALSIEEVLALIAEGASNQRIAAELEISEKTVKTHVGNMLAKLGLGDRTQAAVYAWKSGMKKP